MASSVTSLISARSDPMPTAPSRPIPKADPAARRRRDAKVLALLAAGATVAETARAVGLHRVYLHRRLAQLRAAAPLQPLDRS